MTMPHPAGARKRTVSRVMKDIGHGPSLAVPPAIPMVFNQLIKTFDARVAIPA